MRKALWIGSCEGILFNMQSSTFGPWFSMPALQIAHWQHRNHLVAEPVCDTSLSHHTASFNIMLHLGEWVQPGR